MTAVFSTALFAQNYGILVNGNTYFAGTKMDDFEGFQQYLAHVPVKSGDFCQLCDPTNNYAVWAVDINTASVKGFTRDGDKYTVSTDGCFDFYIKLKYQADELYIGQGSDCGEGVPVGSEEGGEGGEQGEDAEFLLLGSAPSMGSWQGEGAAKFVNGVAEVTVPAGNCEFKVVPSDWNWDNALGFSAVDAGCSSEGISEGDNGNIKITLSEEGTLRVEIKDGKLCVTFSAGAGENPQPTDKDYYLIGSAEAIGGTSWDGTKAVKLVDGVAEVTIPAGECQFKVVPAEGANWDWNHALGAADVNAECSSDGIKSGDNGNVKIEMAAEGTLRVEIKNGKLCVTGSFVAGSEPELTNGYYLIGLTGWDLSAINPAHKFAASDEVEGEFVLTITLAEGNTIKVVEVENDIIKAWFPEGMGTEYTVDADHMGERKIFFRPAGNPEWENFGGFIFISEEMTALENTGIEAQTVKFIRNGQLLIRANGTIMDVTGQVVR